MANMPTALATTVGAWLCVAAVGCLGASDAFDAIMEPIGPPGAIQTLTLVRKDADGRLRSRSLMSVRFVPLTREKN